MITTINIPGIVLTTVTVMVILVMVLVLVLVSIIIIIYEEIENTRKLNILDYQYGGYEPPAPRGVHGNRGGKGKP